MNDPVAWVAAVLVAAVALSVLPGEAPAHTTPLTVHIDRSVERVVQRVSR